MAASTARALRLLELLQSAQLRTVAELAEALGVDERTVRRDVTQLVDLGVPVDSLRGRHGGYRLERGRRVLPLMFSGEELVAVFLGLADAQAAAGGPSVAAQTALSKIERALPITDAHRIDAALSAMTRTAAGHDVALDPGIVLTIAESVSLRRLLDLRYRTGDGVPSRRTVHPYGLVAHAHRWYLLAVDPEKGEERTFRVDRIRTARPVPGTFTPPGGDDLAHRLLEHFVDADYRWHVVLRIRATEDHLRQHLPPSVARVRAIENASTATDGEPHPWHRVEIRAQELDWLPAVLVALDSEIVIDGPEELRDEVRRAATRMLDALAPTD